MSPRRDLLQRLPGSPRLWTRVFRWAPVVLWAAGIFFFSARRHPLGPLSRPGHPGVIGRLSHVAEYAGLTALLYRAFAGEWAKDRACGLALGSAFAYALSDEFHQAFVPGRQCSLLDVGWDLVGAVIALGLIRLGQAVVGDRR